MINIAETSTSPNPIPGSSAVMGNGNDTDHIVLQPVKKGIGETMERQHPRVVSTGFAQLGELAQEAKCPLDFIGEIICRIECAFADIPVDSSIGVSLGLAAKFDWQQFWRH
jgi:hypothetical protein